MTTSVENNSIFKSFFEKQKLNGPNFIDWYRQLRLLLSTKDKENYLEHPISEALVAPSGQQVPPAAVAAHAAWGLRGSKKLKLGALILYVGDGYRAVVEAIGTYHLEVPSGLVIVLNNCHYAPSLTRGVISVSRLFDDSFINCFDENNVILVSKNNLVYFIVVPRDGIFEIDMSCSNTNDSFMFAISNKRAKINLDSSLLWHCCLGHISKKHIEKLQHDGLLNSVDIESLGKCVSCMSGKMARKPYSHQVERAKDLLGLTHTDVYGPFRIIMGSLPIVLLPTATTQRFVREEKSNTARHDVKTTFLNGHLSKEVYIEQPEGFVNPKYPNHVCKLKPSIYGLKQASRQWNKRIDYEIKKFGFTQNHDEPCVYQKASRSYVAILILYVDDVLLMGNNILMLQDVKSYLGRSFAMKDLGDAAYILGIKIYSDRSKWLIGLCQSAYIEKILKRYYMENSKRGTTLMQEKLKLNAEYIDAFDASKEAVWIRKFISGLGIVPTIKEPISMYCDNTRAIAISKDDGATKGARNFHAKVYYLRETIKLEAVNTACYVLNRVLVTKPQNNTPYELLAGRKPIISYLRPFGCHVTILNTIDQLGPSEANNSAGTQVNDDQGAKSEEINLHDKHFVLPIWSLYSTTVKSSGGKIQKTTDCNTSNDALRKEATYDSSNANTNNINLLNVVSAPVSVVSPSRALNDAEPLYPDDPLIPHLEDIYASPSEGIFTKSSYDDEGVVADFNNLETTMNVSPTPTTRIQTIHPKTQILRDPMSAIQTRSKLKKNSEAHAFKVIGTKWVYMNKKDERGVVVRNKARLVSQGHIQEEGIDYDKVFAHVARIEVIRIFLAFASYIGFIVYQIDVKSAFLYGTIDEEVYVTQPPGVDPKFPNKVYKVVKALYGSHQAPRAWYATLSTFLERSGYRRGAIDKNLFIKQDKKDILLVQVYVKQKEDGIFISQDKYVAEILKKFDFLSVKTTSTPIETQKPLVKDEEAADVDVHLYRSMIGSLMYLTAFRPDIMFVVCACSRFQVTPKTSHLQAVKRIFRYLKGQSNLGLWYPKVSSFDLKAYSDSDYASANLDRKSITGGCYFLGRRLISWQCKKQTIVATSTTEAKYVAAAH
nr:putative ribonuclease H-like domain-containing protein [Tanacetum cinerariifolium]